ncbi:hypothetical protein Tco_0596528 [Tanacetum coccineum]
MAESSSQNPSSPEITPKEEPVTLDKPESLNPFLLASQVELEETYVLQPLEMILGNNTYLTQVDYAKLIWEDLIHKLNKKTREKVVPYPRFISLLLVHMMLKYDNEELTINPTQVFNVYN